MELLIIIYLVLFILSVGSIFLLFYKNGEILSNKIFLSLVAITMILIPFIAFTSLPSNFLLERAITGAIGVIGVIAFVAQIVRKESSLIARIIMAISIVINFFLLYY